MKRALALLVLGGIVGLCQAEKPADLKTRLDKKIDLKGIAAETPFKDALAYMSKEYQIKIRIDEAAFKKAGEGDVADRNTVLPPVRGLRLELVMFVLVRQAKGAMEVCDDTLWIVPETKPKAFADIARAASAELKDKLAKKVTVDKEFDADTPLKDVLDYLSDKFDLTIIVESVEFYRAGVSMIADQPVQLAKQKDVALSVVLGKLLKSIGARYVAREDFVLVLPLEE